MSINTAINTNTIKDKSNGIIYLIQPGELIGTNRFKIGCSCQKGLNRCITGYSQNSRYIHIMECRNPFELESIIKKQFNIKFNKISGNEYFEGNEYDIDDEFVSIVTNYKKSQRPKHINSSLSETGLNDFKKHNNSIELQTTSTAINTQITINNSINAFNNVNQFPVIKDKLTTFLDHIKETYSNMIMKTNNKLTLRCIDLYNQYCKFLIDNGETNKISITAFGIELNTHKNICKIRQNSGILVCIDYN